MREEGVDTFHSTSCMLLKGEKGGQKRKKIKRNQF